MATRKRTVADEWTESWLSAVSDGSATMSQRRLSRVEARPGGIKNVVAAARARGVHLAVFIDDRGTKLVAASRHPIRVLC